MFSLTSSAGIPRLHNESSDILYIYAYARVKGAVAFSDASREITAQVPQSDEKHDKRHWRTSRVT